MGTETAFTIVREIEDTIFEDKMQETVVVAVILALFSVVLSGVIL